MSYPTGIVKNADGSFTLTGEFSGTWQTIPAGTPDPGALMVQFFANDLATAINGTSGYPLDNAAALLSGAMAALT